MLKASYANVSKLKYVAQALAKVGDEALLKADADGLTFKVLSPDKLILAVFRMPLTSFEEYHLDEVYTFTIRTDRFSAAVKRGTRNDMLELEYDPENDLLRVVFRDKKTGIPRVFEMQTMPGLSSDIPEPRVTLTTKVLMSTDDFKHILSDSKSVGADSLVFQAKEEELIVRAESEPYEYRALFRVGVPLIDLETPGNEEASYLLAALQAAAKPASAADEVVVEFSTNMPMKIHYKLAGGEDLYLWVAPAV